jgi:hypothetical protein
LCSDISFKINFVLRNSHTTDSNFLPTYFVVLPLSSLYSYKKQHTQKYDTPCIKVNVLLYADQALRGETGTVLLMIAALDGQLHDPAALSQVEEKPCTHFT